MRRAVDPATLPLAPDREEGLRPSLAGMPTSEVTLRPSFIEELRRVAPKKRSPWRLAVVLLAAGLGVLAATPSVRANLVAYARRAVPRRVDPVVAAGASGALREGPPTTDAPAPSPSAALSTSAALSASAAPFASAAASVSAAPSASAVRAPRAGPKPRSHRASAH